MAVMEGQATWLMSEFLARRTGETLVGHPDLAERMNRMSDSGGGEFPARGRAVPIVNVIAHCRGSGGG